MERRIMVQNGVHQIFIIREDNSINRSIVPVSFQVLFIFLLNKQIKSILIIECLLECFNFIQLWT